MKFSVTTRATALVLSAFFSSSAHANAGTEGSYLLKNSSTSNSDMIAKRRAALRRTEASTDSCSTDKAEAIAKRDAMQASGVDKTSLEWRNISRKITFMNSRCPSLRETRNVLASVCKAREASILSKLAALKAADISAASEEMILTELELVNTRTECAEKTQD